MSNVIPEPRDLNDDEFQPTAFPRPEMSVTRRGHKAVNLDTTLPVNFPRPETFLHRRGHKATNLDNTPPVTVYLKLAERDSADVQVVEQDQHYRPRKSSTRTEATALEVASVVIAILAFVAVVVIIAIMVLKARRSALRERASSSTDAVANAQRP